MTAEVEQPTLNDEEQGLGSYRELSYAAPVLHRTKLRTVRSKAPEDKLPIPLLTLSANSHPPPRAPLPRIPLGNLPVPSPSRPGQAILPRAARLVVPPDLRHQQREAARGPLADVCASYIDHLVDGQ